MRRPWYQAQPRSAALMAGVLFLLVTMGHFATDGAGEAVDILYCLPVALLAVTFGLWGGLTGAVIGFLLFTISESVDGTGDIDATGWQALLEHARGESAALRATFAD